jgi:hypothetical protein
MNEEFSKELFANCGINCRTCVGFFGYRLNGERQTPCGGCRTKEKSCEFFKKYCKNLSNREKIKYCFECPDFPCENLGKIDKEYSEKYGSSIIENFRQIKNMGMDEFLKSEKEKWKCPTCGGVTCVHTKRCYTCNP